jgi:hypothetical protein
MTYINVIRHRCVVVRINKKENYRCTNILLWSKAYSKNLVTRLTLRPPADAKFLDHSVLGVELRPGAKPPAPYFADELARDADSGAFVVALCAHRVLTSSAGSRWRPEN